MKRHINWTNLLTFLAVFLIPGIALKDTGIIPAVHAQSQTNAKCSQATVKGSYVIQLTGWVGEGSARMPYASAGTYTADGKGNLSGVDTVVIDGGEPIKRTVSATYTVDPNTCTGTATSPAAGTFNFFILEDGDKITNISTTPGTTITGVSERQF